MIIYTFVHNKRLVTLTCFLLAVLIVVLLSYYILIFDQLNQEFESIEKRSFHSVKMINQMRLIQLVERHHQKAQEINMINLMVRRCIGVYWMSIVFIQMLLLNIFLDEEVLFFEIFYLVYSMIILLLGFSISTLFSWQIISAHKPCKSIYKILARNQHFSFHFKWKIIKWNLLWKINIFLHFYIFRCSIILNI